MSDIFQLLAKLHRPRLLVRAARFGLPEYNRKRDLKRVINFTKPPSTHRAVSCLIAKEAILEEARISGEADYRVSHHVDVLIALMAESQLLPKPQSVA